jgi:hypothetical protein
MTENIVFETEPLVESEEEENVDASFGFTRYLYVVDDVKSSMLLSILNKNKEEAMYWAYELYFSGLKEETFVYLTNIFNFIFLPTNMDLIEFIEKIQAEWVENPDRYWLLGTMVYNMTIRPYDIRNFVKSFCNNNELIEMIDTHNKIMEPVKRKIRIRLEYFAKMEKLASKLVLLKLNTKINFKV